MSARLHTLRKWLVGTLLFVVLGELGLRVVLGNLAIAKLYTVPDDGRCAGLRPNTSVEYTGAVRRLPPVTQEVNGLGYRGPERPRQQPEDVVRVAVLGDSFTYGVGVEAYDTIPAQLEQVLRDTSGRTIEVLNFGIPGVDLPDYRSQFERFAAQWNPDVALFLMEGGDLFMQGDQPRSVCSVLDWPPALREAIEHSYLFRLPLLAYIMAVHRSPTAKPPRELLVRYFTELRASARQQNVTLAVAIIAGRPELLDGDAGEALSSLGIPWIDVTGELRDEHRIPGDGHYNAAGTRVAADAVGRWMLDSDLFQPRHEGGGAPQ